MSSSASKLSSERPVSGEVETNIPARMDRLPWARWHSTIIIALGITWILDGLEVTIVGAIAPRLTEKATLALTSSQAGFQATAYLIGAVSGALFFSYLTEADAIVADIERTVQQQTHLRPLPEPEGSVRVKQRGPVGFITLSRILFGTYPKRFGLGLSLMSTQAFLYNAIFFTYGLVLTKFYNVPSGRVGLYLLPFAVGNFFGPLILGRLFDTVGRKTMIFLTYALSGLLLAISGYRFMVGALNAVTQTLASMTIFFFASAGASSAYLTVSEVFPLEIRAMAIAFFYAAGTGVGGALAPWLYGRLIENSARSVFYGDLLGAGLMVAGGLAALVWGVAAEGKSLEAIAQPLSAVGAMGHHAPKVAKVDATGYIGTPPLKRWP
jgi:MFS family permease